MSIDLGTGRRRPRRRDPDDRPLRRPGARRLPAPGARRVRHRPPASGPLLLAIGDAIPLDQALIVAQGQRGVPVEATPVAVAGGPGPGGPARRGGRPDPGGRRQPLRAPADRRARRDGRSRALRRSGPDAATIAFESYEPPLRERAVEAIAEYGPAALAMLAKYAEDPGFREILGRYGPAVIPPIARADAVARIAGRAQGEAGPIDPGERRLRDGLDVEGERPAGHRPDPRRRDRAGPRRSATSETAYYEFLPLYDVLHLGEHPPPGLRPDPRRALAGP